MRSRPPRVVAAAAPTPAAGPEGQFLLALGQVEAEEELYSSLDAKPTPLEKTSAAVRKAPQPRSLPPRLAQVESPGRAAVEIKSFEVPTPDDASSSSSSSLSFGNWRASQKSRLSGSRSAPVLHVLQPSGTRKKHTHRRAPKVYAPTGGPAHRSVPRLSSSLSQWRLELTLPQRSKAGARADGASALASIYHEVGGGAPAATMLMEEANTNGFDMTGRLRAEAATLVAGRCADCSRFCTSCARCKVAQLVAAVAARGSAHDLAIKPQHRAAPRAPTGRGGGGIGGGGACSSATHSCGPDDELIGSAAAGHAEPPTVEACSIHLASNLDAFKRNQLTSSSSSSRSAPTLPMGHQSLDTQLYRQPPTRPQPSRRAAPHATRQFAQPEPTTVQSILGIASHRTLTAASHHAPAATQPATPIVPICFIPAPTPERLPGQPPRAELRPPQYEKPPPPPRLRPSSAPQAVREVLIMVDGVPRRSLAKSR
jgi:hypothetical protein